MNQKQRILFVIIALLKTDTKKETILEKAQASFDLMRPEILLDDEGRKIFNEQVKKAREKGQIT